MLKVLTNIIVSTSFYLDQVLNFLLISKLIHFHRCTYTLSLSIIINNNLGNISYVFSKYNPDFCTRLYFTILSQTDLLFSQLAYCERIVS